MKSMKSQLLGIGSVLACLCSPAWAQFTLDIGSTQTGTISIAAQKDTYSFTANAGDVFDFTVAATSGSLSPQIQVRNSVGTVIASAANYLCSGSTIELNTVLIGESGTYTVDISDCSDSNKGNYVLYSQRINNPIGAVDLSFGSTEAGMIGSAAQSNTYTFSANAGDQVDFTLTATSGGSLSPKIRLYAESTGTLVANAANYLCSGSTIELNTVMIPTTGTYTVLVGDCSDTNTGSYEIYAQRTDNPGPPVVSLLPGQTQTGTIGSAAQSNTYSFTANAGDVFDFTVVATSGTLSPKIRLYVESPGTLVASAANYLCSGSTIELNTVMIPKTGTYTVLVGDCSDTNTGNYAIYSQRINNPIGIVVPLPFGQTLTGMIGSAAQRNTYTFSANAGDTVDFTLTTTSGSLSPKIRLYSQSPVALAGSAANYLCSGSTIEMNTVVIPTTATYTVLVGDCSDTNTGNYAIYSQRTNNPTGVVPVDWGQVQSGKISLPAQSNTYTFGGGANNVVDFTMVTTSGTLSPKIRLYNPDGSLLSSAANYLCSGSTIEMSSVTLTQNGNYTVLLGDCSDTNTGNYSLSSLCFGTCPNITGISPNYGAPAALIKISGTDFGATQGNGSVTVGGAPSYVASWSNTAIAILVPSHATTGNIVVTTGGVSSNGVAFTFYRYPAINDISPAEGPVGTLVTITGTSLMDGGGNGVVTFNGTPATIISQSATSIQVKVPDSATGGPISVFANGDTVKSSAFTVIPPHISGISPNYGAPAALIKISGTNFGATQGDGYVTVGGALSHVVSGSWSNTLISVTVPSNAATGNIVVTTEGETSNGVPFTFDSYPSITSVFPDSGAVGAAVTLTGINLLDGSGKATVSFNGTPAPIISDTSTSIQVKVPAGATSGPILVHVNGVTVKTINFAVIPPQISAISPNYGAPAALIDITGTNFGATQGNGSVTLGVAHARVVSWSNTLISITVPDNAATGNGVRVEVVVTTEGETSNGAAFTFYSEPSISSLSPTSGPVGTVVTINGNNLKDGEGNATVTFNGTKATVSSDTNGSIQVNVPKGATSGRMLVRVNGVTLIATTDFTVDAGDS